MQINSHEQELTQVNLGYINSSKKHRFQVIDKVKEITDLIEQTEEWCSFKKAEYKMERHREAQNLLLVVKAKRNRFSQTSLRYGYEHPASMEAQEDYQKTLDKISKIPLIEEFQAYQEELNELLQGVIASVMSSLSTTIRVERTEEQGEIACGTDKGGCGSCGSH